MIDICSNLERWKETISLIECNYLSQSPQDLLTPQPIYTNCNNICVKTTTDYSS